MALLLARVAVWVRVLRGWVVVGAVMRRRRLRAFWELPAVASGRNASPAPKGHPRRRLPDRQGNVEDVNFLGSIVRIRVRLGKDDGAEHEAIVALDTFNEPHLKVPDVGEAVTISFPREAAFVLGSSRDAPAPPAEVGAEV